jgi:hypothetical protein
MTEPNPILEPTFRLLPWPGSDEETVSALGLYAETYWAPILYPAAYLLGRRLAILHRRYHVDQNTLHHVDNAPLARALGMYQREATEDKLALGVYHRAMKRLLRYDLVAFRPCRTSVIAPDLFARSHWPRLPGSLLSRLPEWMQRDEPEFWTLETPPWAATSADRVGVVG